MSAANFSWCVLQVTLVGLLTAGLYLGVRRMSPRSAAAVLLAGLTLPLALTAGVCSPWPCWMKETAPPAPIVVAAEPRTEFVAAPHPMAPMPDIEYSSVPADDFETIEDVAIVPATPATPVEITHAPSVTVAQPDWRRLGFALIAAMLLAGVVRLIAGWLAIRRLLAGSRPVEPFEPLQLLAELQQALAVSTTVDLRESGALTTAATVGWRQPAILLPRAWQDWTNGELRAVLAHELAHVARGHYVAWILAQLGLSLHYYHPLLHWLAARLRLEQEYEADALAAEVTGGATAYLRTLAHLALIQPETPVSWPARAFLARPGTVVRRIVRLQQSRVTRPARSLPNAAMLVLMLCGGLVAAGFRQPTRAADNPSDATAVAADTKPDFKSGLTTDKDLPTLEELTQAVAARERAYLPFHIKAMQTFVMSDGLTAVERSKFPWADGRKHQKLMEYAQREPGTWYSSETMLVDGVADMEYERHVSGGREVQVSHRTGETGAGDIYLPDPSRPARPYVVAYPLQGIFPLSGTSEPRLLSEALKQSETETHLDADGENAKLTVVTGPKEFQSRVVVWLSRAHEWHPVRGQFFLRRNVETLLYEWEARKLERQNGQWRVLAGTMQWFDNESQAGSLKKTYALDFEIQEPTYGDAVSAALFSFEIPAGASVRNERDSPVEPAVALTRDVAVTVVDVRGSPLPGATVTSRSRGYERLARELVNFSTDESGRATVRAPDGDFGLLVHKDGSRDANWGLGADVREMKVILAPITAGMVVDEHATPLKDVWVTSDHHSMPQFRFDGVISDPRNNVGFSQRSAWSDDAGRFSLTSELTVRRTSDTVLISAMDLDQEHMASVYVPAAQLGEPLTLMLKRICEINGTCLLEGIKERIPVGLSVEDREGRPLASVATVTSVAENGLRVQFKLRLPPGEYRLQSPHSSGYSAISIPLEVPEGQRTLHLEEQNIKPSGITELIGKPAPALQGSWRSGEETTLEALRGNVVVLDFWGYWCQPCLAGMPKLMEIADEFKDQPVKWLAIHDPHELAREELDAKLAEITKTVWKGRALSFPVMIDAATGDDDRTGVTGERYDVREWPTLIVVDRDGNVAGAVTYDRLRDKIQSLLPEKREDSKTGAETKRTIGAVAAVNAERQAAATAQNIIISGRVTEPDGKPAAGAMVVLPINQGWNGTQRDVVQGVTDGGGRFSLRVPLSSLRTKDWYIRMLWVYRRGFGVATQFVADQLSGREAVRPVEIVLPADSESQFRIVSEAGQPVPGAAVEILSYDDRIGNSHPLPLELTPILAATSNIDGLVVIPGVAEKKLWRIRVSTPQYGEQGFRVAGLGRGSDLQLKKAIPLQGRLTAENPEWVRNVRLQIVTGSGDVDLPGAVCEATATTDEKGEFSVPRMTVGSVYFAAALDSALPVRLQQSNEWRVQEDAELVLRLVPATQVRGRVVRKDDHQPLAGVNVSVQHGIHRQDTSVVTNADGEYETRVLPGRVYVQLGGDFYPELLDRRRGAMTPYEVPAIETSFALPTIELSSTYTRSGRLLDAGGKPLADYQIGAKGEGDLWGSDDITNELGEFRVHFPRDCEIKEYHYQTRLGEERGTATVLSADPLVLQTEATATDKEPRAARPAAEKAESIIITGQVIDAGGTAAAGAMVVLPINSGWGGARRDVAEGATDEEGRYELRVPPEWLPAPPRHYGSTVWAYKAGFGIATASAYMQLQTAEPRRAIDLALHADSKPTFRILDESGAPLTTADVSIENYLTESANEIVPVEILRRIGATPDGNGIVTLTGVEAGMLYQVRVRSDRHGIQTFQVNDLPAGSELKLRSAAPLSGRIVGGRPEWARNVNLVLLSKADRSGPQGRAEVVTDANGQFSVPMMATGDLQIFETLDESLPVRVKLPSGPKVPSDGPLELELIPSRKVKGRVVRKGDQTPVADVEVYLTYDHDRQRDTVVTDAQGEFEAGVVPGEVSQRCVGQFAGRLAAVDDANPPWGRKLEVSESTEPFLLPTIQLTATRTVRGRLVDAAGKPLEGFAVLVSVQGWRDASTSTTSLGEFEMLVPDGSEVESYAYISPTRRSGRLSVETADPLLLKIAADSDRQQGAATPRRKPATEVTVAANTVESITISGRVTEPDGKPAAGAMVMLPMNLGWNEPRRVVQGVTDREGQYSLSVPSEWLGTPMYSAGGTLWAYQPGFALATASVFKQLDPSQPRGDVDLTLPPDSKPKYRFVDEAGKPLADGTASIAYYRSAVGYEPVPQEILERIPATGDADGNVTFVAVESGKLWRIKVRTDRHGTQSFRVDGSPVGAQFQLHAAVPVRGHIAGENPEWIKNVRLNLSTGWDIPGTLIEPEGEAEVRTDESGRFEVPLLATGNLTIIEFLDQSLPVRLEILNLPMPVPTETPLEFRLVPAQKVKGRVVRKAGGAPVAGVHVHVGYGHFRQSDSAVTNANGEFEAGALPGQVYQQVLLIPDKSLEQVGSPWSERYEIPRSEEPFQLPTIELVGTHTQSGRLVDDAGKPLAKHMVWCVAGNRGYGFANTEANGEFELRIPDGVEVERYGFNSPADEMGEGVVVTSEPLLLRAKPHKRVKQPAAAQGAAKAENIALSGRAAEPVGDSQGDAEPASRGNQARSITIRAVDSSGRPVEGANVFRNHVYQPDQGGPPQIENENYLTDAEGKAVVSLAGKSVDLRLWVRKDGFVPLHAMWSKDLQSDGDQIPAEFTFELPAGTVVGGIVKNERGEPIQGTRVEVRDLTAFAPSSSRPDQPGQRPVRGYELAYGEDAVFTDVTGRWTLNTVPADDILNRDAFELNIDSASKRHSLLSLRLSHPEYASDYSWGGLQGKQAVTLAALRAGTATVIMPRGDSLSGQVTDADGKAVTGALAVLSDFTTDTDRGPLISTTNANGEYEFDHLSGPQRLLAIIAPEYPVAFQAVSVSPSSRADIALARGIPLVAQFLDDSGKPISSVSVWVGELNEKPFDDIRSLDAVKGLLPHMSDADGRFEWLAAPGDRLRCSCSKPGYKPTAYTLSSEEPTRTVRLHAQN